MDEFEAKISDIQERATEGAIAEMHSRRRNEGFVIFKNIPDNNYEERDIQFIVNLLKNEGNQCHLEAWWQSD